MEAGKPVLIGPTFGGKGKFELKEKCFETAGILERAGLAVGAGMTEEGAWRAITINPARVIGIADRVGSLEVGKDADTRSLPTIRCASFRQRRSRYLSTAYVPNPDADPDQYTWHPAGFDPIAAKANRPNLGFVCVLMEKDLA